MRFLYLSIENLIKVLSFKVIMKKEGRKEPKEPKKETGEKSRIIEKLGYISLFFIVSGIAFFLWLAGIVFLLLSFLTVAIVLFVIVLIAGIWIIKHRGFLVKLMACFLLLLFVIGALLVVFYYVGSPKEIKGEERETILTVASPMVENFLNGYNNKDYTAISRDFMKELKNLTSPETFPQAYNLYGKYISKGEARILKQTGKEGIAIEYPAEFEKASLAFSLIFLKINESYSIAGYGFNSVKLKEKSTEFNITKEKVLESIETSKLNHFPEEGKEYKYFDVYLKNNNSFFISVNKISFYAVDNYIYSNLDFERYPDLKEFCKPFEIGELKSYETEEGCIIFILPKGLNGELKVDVV